MERYGERAIATKYCWSFNEEGHEGKPVRKESGWFRELDKKQVGDKIFTKVAAPGTGHIIYMITRKTKTRIYGILVESTVRELTEADVI